MELWRQKQKESFTSVSSLIEFLELDKSSQKKLLKNSDFPLVLPRRLAEKIPKNCLTHPLALQFLPISQENTITPLCQLDPLQEKCFFQTDKLLHKYQGRVLLLCTQACAMHCRYCFRRHTEGCQVKGFEKEFAYIQNNKTIKEVILSGGDPLSLSDARILEIATALDKISHVEILRVHSRFPVGIPERITDSFIQALKASNKTVVFVLHTNHADELDACVCQAMQKLQKHQIMVFSQAVLLKGVNNSAETLETLFMKQIQHGIVPYYLHQFDPVQNANHFAVPISQGLQIMDTLRNNLPGYAVPRYVQERPHETSKTPIFCVKS